MNIQQIFSVEMYIDELCDKAFIEEDRVSLEVLLNIVKELYANNHTGLLLEVLARRCFRFSLNEGLLDEALFLYKVLTHGGESNMEIMEELQENMAGLNLFLHLGDMPEARKCLDAARLAVGRISESLSHTELFDFDKR